MCILRHLWPIAKQCVSPFICSIADSYSMGFIFFIERGIGIMTYNKRFVWSDWFIACVERQTIKLRLAYLISRMQIILPIITIVWNQFYEHI